MRNRSIQRMDRVDLAAVILFSVWGGVMGFLSRLFDRNLSVPPSKPAHAHGGYDEGYGFQVDAVQPDGCERELPGRVVPRVHARSDTYE